MRYCEKTAWLPSILAWREEKTRCVCCVSCVCVCRLTDWHTLSVSSWTLGLSGAPGSQELLLRSTLFWNVVTAALSSTGSSTEVKEAGWSWRVDISAFFHVEVFVAVGIPPQAAHSIIFHEQVQRSREQRVCVNSSEWQLWLMFIYSRRHFYFYLQKFLF